MKKQLVKNLVLALEQNNFNVIEALTSDEGLKLIKEHKPDIIILNANLHGLTGIQIASIVKTKLDTKNIPIIMIASENKNLEKIKNIDGGIDDFLIQPFQASELIKIIKNILRKNKPVFTTKFLEYKDLKMDVSSFRVIKNEIEIRLGPTEFKILKCLMEYPKRVLTREYIMSYVWGSDNNVENRTIDVHINRLRNILKGSNDNIPLIKTIRAAGYSLDGPDNS